MKVQFGRKKFAKIALCITIRGNTKKGTRMNMKDHLKKKNLINPQQIYLMVQY